MFKKLPHGLLLIIETVEPPPIGVAHDEARFLFLSTVHGGGKRRGYIEKSLAPAG
jgi:hypothetical protein